MGAYKKHDGKKYYFDMTNIKANYVFLHANAMSRKKQRELRRIDPFAHVVGSYRKYRTPEDLKEHIDDYFKSCTIPMKDENGEIVHDRTGKEIMVQVKPLTISGMANHLGIATDTLRTYQVRAKAGKIPPEYADIIISARQKIEEYAESQLYSRDGSRGGQFVLQAGFGWQTKQERNEVKVAKRRMKMQEREFELKKKLIDSGSEEDSTIEVRITRASKRAGETEDEDD